MYSPSTSLHGLKHDSAYFPRHYSSMPGRQNCVCVPLVLRFVVRLLFVLASASDGLYLEHKGVGITQYMFATFLPSQSCRKYLKLRKQQTVDFRAACFCHKRVVDIAYV